MKQGTEWLVLLVLLALPLAAHAIPLTNLDDVSRRTGYVANLEFQESLRYEADTDRLFYSFSDTFTYSNRLICQFPCQEERTDFDGILSWTAGVDERGIVTEPGAMVWLGDFGLGFEVLASGRLRDVGVASTTFRPDDNTFELGNLQFLFGVDFLDARVSGMGEQILLLFEQQFISRLDNPFQEDFDCGLVTDHSALPACSPFSTSGIIGLNVPEPQALALFGIVLAGLGFMRRGRTRGPARPHGPDARSR